MKTLIRTFFFCVVLFGLVGQVQAQEGPLSGINGTFSASNVFVQPGQTFTVTNEIRNDGSQTVNGVSAHFAIDWGLNQATNQISLQSVNCTGVLAGVTFATGFSTVRNVFSSNPGNFTPGATATCTATFQIESSAPVGEMFEMSTEVGTLTGGDLVKTTGGDVITVDSLDRGICENIDPNQPTPTPIPSACSIECGSGFPACGSNSICQLGRCVPTLCTLPNFQCDPSTCLALCPNVTMTNTAPKVGDLVNFQCTLVPGAVRYKFQVIAPSGEISHLESVSNTSDAFELDQQGHYDVQCQMCMGATEDTCLAPQQM